MTLAEINDELGAARTNKKEFLEKLETIIPWETFFELIQPSCYKGELGNKPYPLELMLRIFILQSRRHGSHERSDRQPCILQFLWNQLTERSPKR